jgi:hypothetical protein
MLAVIAISSAGPAMTPSGLDANGNLQHAPKSETIAGLQVARLKDGVQIRIGEATKNIIFYGSEAVRVNTILDKPLTEHASLAVVGKPSAPELKIAEKGDGIQITSDHLLIAVDGKRGALTFMKPDGSVILREDGQHPSVIKQVEIFGSPTYEVTQRFTLKDRESLYGLGQYTDTFWDYRGQEVYMAQSNIGICIPFLISTERYGIMWDIYSKSIFKDGPEGMSLYAESAPGGIDYYFMAGETVDEVIVAYRDLTGAAPMFSKKSFGLWMCKERYKTQDRVIEVVRNFRQAKYSIDNIVQDWQYWGGADGSWSGKVWHNCIDRRDNKRTAPHEYVQLDQPIKARYVKLTNVYTPAGAVFSVSGLRLFGSGMGKAPQEVRGVAAERQANRRLMKVSWKRSPSTDFYIVRYGIKPDRLTLNYQVYDGQSVTIPGLNTDQDYFVTVDAINDTGVTQGTEIQPARTSGVPSDKDMAAYLLVYFKDEDHSLHFALSSDGYSFTDVNGGKPVIEGRDIAKQKGVRDPYIMRGPDNLFYMAMTDLHIYAQREGLRATEWQRDSEKYGWGNNRSLVLMKSSDLINWSSANLRVDQAFPGLEELGCVWAPEMVWNEKKDRIMLHFSMRSGNGDTRLYASDMDPQFSKMETKPELLLERPKGISYNDSDITRVGDKFYLLYAVYEDGRHGIKLAVSDHLDCGYQYRPEWVNSEQAACEAPNVWKRNGQDKWVLMYDIYGLRPPNFGFRETTDFKTFTDLGRFNEGVMKATNFSSPKHGAIMSLTAAQARRLADHWGVEKY